MYSGVKAVDYEEYALDAFSPLLSYQLFTCQALLKGQVCSQVCREEAHLATYVRSELNG